jgi:hypothetical protein
VISRRDGHFLAGFLDGEAHFAIREVNAGLSDGCLMAVVVRDDDADLLERLRAITGLGTLSRIPAVAGSRPQVRWTVQSRRDCARLVRLLAAHQLRGRKAAEFEIWRHAVRAWSELEGDARRARMRALRSAIRRARQYRDPGDAIIRCADDPADLLAYVCGLITAEGWLGFSGDRPRFAVKMRADEMPLLRGLAEALGWGAVYGPYGTDWHPAAVWIITRQAHLQDAARRLSDIGLGGRKQRVLEPWSRAVLGQDPRAREQVREEMLYRPPDPDQALSAPRDRVQECVTALREWASAGGEPGCLGYQRFRLGRPELPDRNTIVRRCGSWQAALSLAGLDDRARRRDGPRAPRAPDQHRLEQTLAAVRRCAAELGRPPRAMEYFRWRLERAPGSPSQATVYRAFPGGWAAVLAAAGL